MSTFGLVPLPAIARLSPRVCCVLGLNPSAFTLQGTNTYLVGTGASRILIDTGAGVAGYLPSLLSCMQQAGCDSLSCILCTHWHHDHTGGLHDIALHFSPPPPVYKHLTHMRGAAPPGLTLRPLSPSSSFTVEGASLSCLATPGHTADHCSFLLQEEHALFIGDAVLGQGSSVFRQLYDYTRSLQAVQQLAPLRLYCGHGPLVDEVQAKLSEYLQHRQQREQQLLQALQADSARPCSALQLVLRVYPPLSPAVQSAAVQNVVLHLEKLQLEGRIRRLDDGCGSGEGDEPTAAATTAAAAAAARSSEAGSSWLERDYGELTESTGALVQRKAHWLWQPVLGGGMHSA